MTMTVGELRNILECLDDDVEVRIAEQPRWAFEYTINNAYEVEVNRATEDNPDAISVEILYIVEGTQIGYLPQEVAEQIGW